MNTKDIYNSKAVAVHHSEAGSNKVPYLGLGLFPAKKKTSLDLKYITSANGVPVSLAPSAFDTVSTIRSREGVKITEAQLAFFKESMVLSENDEQNILRLKDTTDPFAGEVIDTIYNDAETLIGGAEVVPERMRMQLLASPNGHPSIYIAADGATYAYNYDKNNEYSASNYTELLTNSKWSDTTNSNPIEDVRNAQDAVEAKTGSRPTKMIVSRQTMNYILQNVKVKSYVLAQNTTANVIMTDARVKELFLTELGVNIIVYTKLFKDENGSVQKFYPDGYATLVPDGALGSTWFGMTPEERTLLSKPDYDVSVVETGITVTISVTDDPVHTKTTVSEVVLPSFERMFETYTIKAY